MNKAKYLLLLITAILIIGLMSHKPAGNSFLPTKLKVAVISGLGNPVEGAIVILYKTKDDYINTKNPFKSDTTDIKGIVKY